MPSNVPETPKKGRKSWRPAQMLDVTDKPEGYRTRWVLNDPANIQRKRSEGWLPADGINGPRAKHNHPDGVEDGKPLTGLTEYRELQAWTLDEETAQARDEYFQEQADQNERSIKDRLRADMAKAGAPSSSVHGKIVID